MILLTGLSGAGKSTLAAALQAKLTAMQIPAEVIDGDHYRQTINRDLGFSAAGRRENISRLAKLAHNKTLHGITAIVAAINPFEDQRTEFAKVFQAIIIWVRCDLTRLIERDTKGLYHKALLPEDHPDKLWNLSGVNDLYETPQHANLIIDTSNEPVEISLKQLLAYVLTAMNA